MNSVIITNMKRKPQSKKTGEQIAVTRCNIIANRAAVLYKAFLSNGFTTEQAFRLTENFFNEEVAEIDL